MSDNDNFRDVGDFHTKFGLPSVTTDGAGSPGPISRELIAFRVLFLVEELMEFVEALGGKLDFDPESNSWHFLTPKNWHDGENVEHDKAFDALMDMTYVAMGNAHIMGYPWQAGWDEVQRANMSKVRAAADGSDSVRGTSFDVVKPPGFIPPDIEAVLEDEWADKPDPVWVMERLNNSTGDDDR